MIYDVLNGFGNNKIVNDIDIEYILNYTNCYVDQYISATCNSHVTTHEHKNECNSEYYCCICFDEIKDDFDPIIKLNCNHVYHINCLKLGVQSYVEQERMKDVQKCHYESCSYILMPDELALVTSNPNQLTKIQKMMLRTISILKICPKCDTGIIEYDEYAKYNAKCIYCEQELCFSCGNTSHIGMNCDELNDMNVNRDIFIQSIIDAGQSNRYGHCPHCNILIEKKDGCDSMTCGNNAEDKNKLLGNAKDRGCGKTFDWNKRVPLKGKNKEESKEEVKNGKIGNYYFYYPPPKKINCITRDQAYQLSKIHEHVEYLSRGLQIYVSDVTNKWYQSTILEIKEDEIFIHYNGWGDRWDQWIPIDSHRLRIDARIMTLPMELTSTNTTNMSPAVEFISPGIFAAVKLASTNTTNMSPTVEFSSPNTTNASPTIEFTSPIQPTSSNRFNSSTMTYKFAPFPTNPRF